MKMTDSDYASLRDAIQKLFAYPKYDFKSIWNNYRKSKLSDTRFRWDAMWASGFKPDYSYLKDCHIDTALRKIIAELDSECEG